MTEETDTHSLGHGWVRPRPDGARMRCGGPKICSKCALELARYGSPPKYAEENPLNTTPKVKLSVAKKSEINWIEIKKDLALVLNKHSLDNYQATPDFMLADFLLRSLRLHREFVMERARWFEGVSL